MSLEFDKIHSKIHSFESIENLVEQWRTDHKTIVFTNGCFDLLHFGHLHYLAAARDLGDKLVVGLNSADSVKRLKGAHRPLNDELTRQHLLAALQFVDAVVVFQEDTPFELIQCVRPDILVKGGDYQPNQIVGADIVLRGGGKVLSLPFVEGYSTTNLESKIRNSGV
ncbi:MAG: D-glycero-beta-D-manno-heptose 1-phosphate adenylyltransferase [Saprospiraceae bacterium]|nr:D-glycero-beta-D-manno-heptose 1-phosphate adenylyltransferase [Saprospiraceae bacterium]